MGCWADELSPVDRRARKRTTFESGRHTSNVSVLDMTAFPDLGMARTAQQECFGNAFLFACFQYQTTACFWAYVVKLSGSLITTTWSSTPREGPTKCSSCTLNARCWTKSASA